MADGAQQQNQEDAAAEPSKPSVELPGLVHCLLEQLLGDAGFPPLLKSAEGVGHSAEVFGHSAEGFAEGFGHHSAMLVLKKKGLRASVRRLSW